MLIWIENAPEYGKDDTADVTSFIDQIITCQRPRANAELLNLVNRQVLVVRIRKLNVDSITLRSL